jgi:transposase
MFAQDKKSTPQVILHFWNQGIRSLLEIHKKTNIPIRTIKYNVKKIKDNDPKHTSFVAKQFLQANMPIVIDWPSNSPDLKPIENLWSIVKTNVERRRPKNLDELRCFMVEE